MNGAIEREGGFVAGWRVRSGDAFSLHRDRAAALDYAAQRGGLIERLPQPVEVDAEPVARCRRCSAGVYVIADDAHVLRGLCIGCGLIAAGP